MARAKSKKAPKFRDLTPQEKRAVRRFADYHGLHNWKSALATRWARGNTQPFGDSGPDDGALLYALRNSHGGQWLEDFQDLASLDRNPTMTSRKGKRRGKRSVDVSDYDIARAKKSGTPFVMDIDDKGYHESEVFILNPLDLEGDYNDVKIFWFSNGMGNAPGVMRIAVLNKNVEDGLEEAAGWIADHAPPAYITKHDDPYLKELYDEALKELVDAGEDPEDEQTQSQAFQDSTEEMTYTESGYFNSYEWGLDDLNPGTELYDSIINKSLNLYRKEYGEEPRDRYASQNRRHELRQKYGDRIKKTNPQDEPTARMTAIAARLARGEN